MKKILIIATIIFVAISIPCFPDTIYVPADQPTIQAGIDTALNGDTVLVAPGTYVENIDFIGKAITVISAEGAASTVIDGGNSQNPDYGSTVSFMNAEGPDSVLDGFQIINGSGTLREIHSGEWNYCGGGIYGYGTAPTLVNLSITDNSAVYGGGIYIDSYQFADPHYISNCYIAGNHAECGGGVYCNHTMPIIENCIVENHTNGGGLFVSPYTHFHGQVKNCVIRKNINIETSGGSFFSGRGGGVYGGGSLTISGCTITENRGTQGGGICSYYNDIRNNIITYNVAEESEGGGIYSYGTECEIDGNLIAYNYARTEGGGVRLYGGSIMNNEICFNTAGVDGNITGKGGGVCLEGNWSNHGLYNCLIYKNHSHGQGGGLYLDNWNVFADIVNFTIVGNTATEGNAIYASHSHDLRMYNSILWNNSEDEICYTIRPQVRYCNIWGGFPGEGNIEANPLFVDAGIYDFHLRYDSPCRDAGNAGYVNASEDNENDPRVVGSTVDIGADEFSSHFYCTGDFTPDGLIDCKLIGIPDTEPTGVFIGSGVLDPPQSHVWGDFYLASPWFLIPLISIPSNGVLQVPARIPPLPIDPYDIPMQALIGWELSNLFVLEVKW